MTPCANTLCHMPAALLRDDVARCFPCHRDANNGRIV